MLPPDFPVPSVSLSPTGDVVARSLLAVSKAAHKDLQKKFPIVRTMTTQQEKSRRQRKGNRSRRWRSAATAAIPPKIPWSAKCCTGFVPNHLRAWQATGVATGIYSSPFRIQMERKMQETSLRTEKMF
uniref:Uncharacterized protein n=1 Tax=Setaria viridis TaxID=4556 RepID=A0A4V6D931_SETVI|nr:hypothetical protein SEVIR_3G048700v2 [Setaria viridis]TKW24396.1 hypothetical protein SEVIR_3G048700v2 [Setaria viridis]